MNISPSKKKKKKKKKAKQHLVNGTRVQGKVTKMYLKRSTLKLHGIICSGLIAYIVQIRSLFLRTSGSSGVIEGFLA